MREFITDAMAAHISQRLAQIHFQQLNTENCYEVWLKIRMLDMALGVPKTHWVTQQDVAAHVGVRAVQAEQEPREFEKMLYQTLMVRAHESEIPPSLAQLVKLYLHNLFKKSAQV